MIYLQVKDLLCVSEDQGLPIGHADYTALTMAFAVGGASR
jgi:hypothetical protein